MNKVNYPFWVVVNKEISDHVKSWRFIILMGIILLTCMGSLYTSLTNIGAAGNSHDEALTAAGELAKAIIALAKGTQPLDEE